jgi:hypothetical protein
VNLSDAAVWEETKSSKDTFSFLLRLQTENSFFFFLAHDLDQCCPNSLKSWAIVCFRFMVFGNKRHNDLVIDWIVALNWDYVLSHPPMTNKNKINLIYNHTTDLFVCFHYFTLFANDLSVLFIIHYYCCYCWIYSRNTNTRSVDFSCDIVIVFFFLIFCKNKLNTHTYHTHEKVELYGLLRLCKVKNKWFFFYFCKIPLRIAYQSGKVENFFPF